MTRVAAVILAGGRGERLGGVNKANLEVGGLRLLERVAVALGPLPAPILVAHGTAAPAALRLLPGQIAVPDLATEYAGPLAGVAGAVAWLSAHAPDAELLVTVAVDTPFVPHDFVARLVESVEKCVAVVARYGDQDYPTNAIWRLGHLTGLPRRLREGTAPHSLKRLAAELEAAALSWDGHPGGDPFANVNTPADLATLQRRAGNR